MAKSSSERKLRQRESQGFFRSKILMAIFGSSVAEIVIRLIFIVAVVGTLAIITVGLLSPGTSPAASSSISQSSLGHPVGLQVGDTAPNFTLTAPEGKKVSLNDYRGKPLMLNFWYASCPGCLTEIPGMQRFYTSQHTARRNFVILGVNSVDDVSTARQFVQEYGLTYQIVMDSDQSVAGLYHVTATPTSYFIDRQGIIRSVVVGPVDDTTLQQDVAQISA